MKPKIVALVPMRHKSERVIGKNYREFCGKPLYSWIVQTLAQCESIDMIYIDTDSAPIKQDAPQIAPKVHIIDRPEHLRSGHTSMNEILLHDVSLIEADYYLQTHSTNPLLQATTIENAITRFLEDGEHDSLFGVTRWQTRLYDHEGKPINHDPSRLERTQDLPPIYEENSNIYIFSKASLQAHQNRIGAKPILFEISRFEAADIDEEFDFKLTEIMAQEGMQPSPSVNL